MDALVILLFSILIWIDPFFIPLFFMAILLFAMSIMAWWLISTWRHNADLRRQVYLDIENIEKYARLKPSEIHLPRFSILIVKTEDGDRQVVYTEQGDEV